MNKFLSFSVFMITFLCMSFAFGQNGQKPLTLEECIELGLKNNSELKTAVYQVDRSGANVKGSYSNVLPRISSTFQSGRSTIGQTSNLQNIPVVEPVTVIDVNTNEERIIFAQRVDANGQSVVQRVQSTSPTQSFWGHSLTLRYNQTLFDFGRSWNLISQAKASFNASSESLTAARFNVYAKVKQRYFELLKAARLADEYRLAVERSKEQLTRTQSMYEIGSVAQIDVYRQEVILGTDEVNLINQKNIVKIAEGNLNVAMGRDPETSIQIVDTEAVTKPVEVTLQEAYAIAQENNPQLRRFRYDMDAAEHGRKAAKGQFWPTIGLGITYQRDNEQLDRVYGSFGENYFVNIGGQLNFDIFNGFSDVAEVERQSANYSIAKESWINQKHTLDLEVKQAFLNLNAFQEIAKINERNLRAAEEEFRLAEERYRVGAGTQLEVTDSQVSLTRARVNLVRAKYDALIARAQLEAAMGVISEEEN